MDKPLRITFDNLQPSEAVEADVRSRMARLDAICDRMTGARVVIGSPHRGPTRAKTYAVRIELALPGHDLVVSREPVGDLQGAMTAAFEVARRRLRGIVERSRGA